MPLFRQLCASGVSPLVASPDASAAIVLATFRIATAKNTRRLIEGEKAKVAGSMLSRDGDLVRVRDKKSDRPYVSYRSLMLL